MNQIKLQSYVCVALLLRFDLSLSLILHIFSNSYVIFTIYVQLYLMFCLVCYQWSLQYTAYMNMNMNTTLL